MSRIGNMTEKQAPSYPLRMPQELREQLTAVAKANNRSMNAEIVAQLERKPIRYHLQVHLSLTDHAVWHAESESPFPTISIGDRFNHRSLECVWDPEPQDGQTYRVKDIAHIFGEQQQHLSHLLQVFLEITDLPRR